MERIKQALELARQEREKQGGNAKSQSRVKYNQGLSEKNIEYTSTRSVGVSIDELREQRVIVDQQSSVSKAYKILRTQILLRLKENNWNTLAITSPRVGNGKSLTAINLAISLASEVDYTVLLVDANLQSPSIHNYFNFKVEQGLSDYLCADALLGDILVHPDGIPKFVILPAGQSISNSSEMLSSPKMNHLVNELKDRYPSRIVLFNLPPLLESSDALAFLPNVDATLVVVEEGKTKEQDLRQFFELVKGHEVIGSVLNKAYTREREYGNLDIKQSVITRMLNKWSTKVLPGWMR